MEHQDWNQVVLSKPEELRKKTKIIEEKKKVVNNGNNRKLDEETETFHHKLTPKDKIKQIVKLRSEKGLNQVQLAQKCNLPPKDIKDIESNNAIYNAQKVEKILRILNR